MSQARKEALIEKIMKDLEEEEKIKGTADSGASKARIAKRKGFIQRLQDEKQETGLDGVVLKAQEVAIIQANELAQEEKLAAEMSLIRHQEIVDEKMRQYLRENSHELKELESCLKAAYTNKMLAAQGAEIEAKKAQGKFDDLKARQIMLAALGSLDEMEERAMMAEKKRKEEYRRSLQDQIIEKERIRQEEYIAFFNEKKLFDDTIRKIKEEEEKERAEELYMKQKVKEEMEKFYMARELWKARERIIIDDENRKIEAIAKMKAEKEAERTRIKASKSDEKERLLEEMITERLAQSRLKEERKELLQVLHEREEEDKARRKEREKEENHLAMKREARAEIQRLFREKERKRKEEKELDRKFVEQMNLKFQEETRREKEKEELKRQARINDRKYNEEKIKRNIEAHAASIKLAQMETEFREEQERKREQMIEEERMRMLKEHAPCLMGYFPKGCLKESDLENLGMTSNSPLPESCRCLENK